MMDNCQPVIECVLDHDRIQQDIDAVLRKEAMFLHMRQGFPHQLLENVILHPHVRRVACDFPCTTFVQNDVYLSAGRKQSI